MKKETQVKSVSSVSIRKIDARIAGIIRTGKVLNKI
jgi:hypothetical protein